jgi:dienelactone hydrolase
VARAGDRRAAESQLAEREQRHRQLDIVELEPDAQARYLEAWRAAQGRFVDDPATAIREADALVTKVLRERGYPVEDLARSGAVAILIDAPFNRPQQGRVRSDPLTFTPKDRDEQIQLIVDLRRAVDLLVARPDVDRARLAYVGVSYGAAMGGLLAGVEDRLKAYVLAVGDGGLVSHVTGPDDANRPEVQSFPAEQREQWLQAMRPIEPINFVGQAAPAALLFQAGTKDELIPRQDTLRYYQAASQPKELRWYDAGQFLNCAASNDMMAWLARHIRIDPRRYRCTP